MSSHTEQIAAEMGLRPAGVAALAALLADGATVPFIARYRKEATGSLDEVCIVAVRDRLAQLAALDARREAILKSLRERDLLTAELARAVADAATPAQLEDVYLPYRPKRRTRGEIARQQGLEPLADLIFEQRSSDPSGAARRYLSAEKGVATVDDALAGARDIIAERLNESAEIRACLRPLFAREGLLTSSMVTGKAEEGAKFRDYFDRSEPVRSMPSHRLLAAFRGEREGFLRVSVRPPDDRVRDLLLRRVLRGTGPCSDLVAEATRDAYRRLLGPSLETEVRNELKERADGEAIRVFAENLRQLLMAPPLGHKTVLALDPGFRTGCKTVCLDSRGDLLHHTVVFPHDSGRRADATRMIRTLCREYGIEAIAVGNGTAGRETEEFLREADPGVPVYSVDESGASVYSVSEAGREEFPDLDPTVRGAISIGRRLLDPLAELVKIDPQAIGVGQYQHDVDPNRLKSALDDVVVGCVNAVGVDVNTAGKRLLTYVSGLGPALAGAVVAYRDAHGPFVSRAAFLKVPRLGPKAFQQAAGFLRIPGAANPLDASAVHPERYTLVTRMARDGNVTVADLMSRAECRDGIVPSRYVDADVGLPTVEDILVELAKPGRDPRGAFEAFHFSEDVHSPEDLEAGMSLPGIVTNVTRFGAFVDIGVHRDGLVHVSEMADRYIADPAEVVRVRQKVRVTVLAVDRERGRITLSMRRTDGSSADG